MSMTIGWREWVEFPEWGFRLKAKADTGARSSAIDCAEIVELPDDRVRFTVRLDRKRNKFITLEANILARKKVRSSIGRPTNRFFVETKLRLAGMEKRIVVSLVCRKRMIHRLLLGREALADHFIVDPSVDHWATPRKPLRKSGSVSPTIRRKPPGPPEDARLTEPGNGRVDFE